MKQLVAVIGAMVLLAAAALADTRTEAIAERLQPVGEICMAGDACTGGASVQVATGEPRDAAEIYQGKCAACHNTGVAGAPKLGEVSDWEARVAKGMEVVFENAWNGLNAMPPKGLCMDCSEQEMRATIEYMIDESI